MDTRDKGNKKGNNWEHYQPNSALGAPPAGLSKGDGVDDDIPTPSPIWWITKDGDDYCRELFDRHYSRRRYADGRESKLFVGPGEKLVLRTWESDALWVWRKFIDDSPLGGV